VIVPQTRLLSWFAVVVLPFSALGAVYPEALLICLALIAAWLVVAVLDASLALGCLEGIAVGLPAVVRLSKERPGTFAVQITNPSQKSRRLRLGLSLPREVLATEEMDLALPAGAEQCRVEWNCRPLKRGRYTLQRAGLEGRSPLGLWAVRAVVPVHSEIRVYPNLGPEPRHLAALFLHRGAFGLHAQRQLGKGREFEKLREYVHGDSFDDIHWKATAKRGHPVTKVFQIERTQEIYVIIDASRLSARPAGPSSTVHGFPSAGSRVDGQSPTRASERGAAAAPGHRPGVDTTLERFLTSALALGLVAEQQGDLFGLLTFSDRVEAFLRARNGPAHYDACRDALYTLEPRLVTPDFEEVATFLRLRLRRRALLIFLASLDDPLLAEGFVRSMELLCRQHLVLVNMLRPAGAAPLFSHPDVNSTDDLYRELGGHLQWHKLRELEKVLQRRGVRFSLLDNERMSVQLVSQYVSVKQRQLL
jgi:uncharacterized protein (DUF58 family)